MNLDQQLQELFAPTRDLTDAVNRSRERTRQQLRSEAMRPQPIKYKLHQRRRGLQLAVSIVLVAAAAFAAIALLPNDRSGDGGQHRMPAIAGLATSASAAESLAWAGNVVIGGDAPVAGVGNVWHGVTRSYRDGTLSVVNEQWFAPQTNQYRMAAYGIVTGDDPGSILLIDEVNAAGTQQVRTYFKPKGSDVWSPKRSGSALLELDIPRGQGPRQRQLGTEMLHWMHSAANSSSRSVINAETRRFMSVTFADQFRTMPAIRLAINTDGTIAENQHGATRDSLERREQYDKADQASRIRQAMYLLTTMRPSAEATRYLYSRIGAFDDLERLSNVMVNGRLAIRIRFDATDPELAPTIERVLVIDARTGYAVRTETLDRSAWTTVAPSHHVQTVGADPIICGEITDVPCDLINGNGRAADAAQQIASTFRPLASNDGFSTSWPIAPRPHIEGVGYSDGGAACGRDANWVSICRG